MPTTTRRSARRTITTTRPTRPITAPALEVAWEDGDWAVPANPALAWALCENRGPEVTL